MLRSLRAKVIATMSLLIALVLVIAAIGVNSIHSLDRSVDRELNLLLAGTQLSNGLVSTATSEIRSAEQYLVCPAAACAPRSAPSAPFPLPMKRLAPECR